MNEIVSKFLLAGTTSCLKRSYVSVDLRIVLVEHLLKVKKEYIILNKQEIQDILIKTI